MNKKLMQQQESQIKNFLEKEVKEDTVKKAYRYAIDSVIEDRFRLLTSEAKKPIPRGTTVKQLASFDLWKKSVAAVVETKEAFQMVGIRKSQVKEGRVFVKLDDKTLEITEFVRQEIKGHYSSLLKREFSPVKKEKRDSA